ncbi:MAG: hypothetical protein GEU77_17320 [Deltaproteobacteria bacterium]|nr:hypothetical protein [Deltaproteobacteria bacterium]
MAVIHASDFSKMKVGGCQSDDVLIDAKQRHDSESPLSIHVIDEVSGDHRTGARHILDDDVRLARNVLRQVFSEQPRIQIVDVPGFGAGDDGNGFAGIVGRLRDGRRAPSA